MEADFWHERWQRGELGWHLDEVNPLLVDYWDRLGLDPGITVLVPLCGKTRDMQWLAQRGHSVLGVELSRAGAEAFFAEAGLTPEISDAGSFRCYQAGRIRILCGDFFDLTPRDLADVGAVYDRGALVALNPELRERYVGRLLGSLDAPKPTLLISFDYPQDEMDGPPFAVDQAQLERFFGKTHRVRELAALDVLSDQPRFRERGLSRLSELVVALEPLAAT